MCLYSCKLKHLLLKQPLRDIVTFWFCRSFHFYERTCTHRARLVPLVRYDGAAKKTSKKKSFREVFFTAMFKANESRRSSASALVRGESGVAATAPGVSLSSIITAVDSLVPLTSSATFSSLIDGN